MGCSASKESKGREDYSTLRADSSPNVPLVSAASVRPTARELLVIPDNTSRSSVLVKSTQAKQTIPEEPSTPSHSIDPFQSIVTRDSPPRASVKKTSPVRATTSATTIPISNTRQQKPTSSLNQENIQVIPNSSRDTKSRNSHTHTHHSHKKAVPPTRHQGDSAPLSAKLPERKTSHSPPRVQRIAIDPPPLFASSGEKQHSSTHNVASVVSSVAAPSVVVPPPTTTTPHYPHDPVREERHSSSSAPKKHKKKKKKRSKEPSRERESTKRSSTTPSDNHHHKERRPSKSRDSTTTERESAASDNHHKAPPTRASRQATLDKFKPRLSQKAFSMFSIETPQPCSKSGMKFEELYKLSGVLGTGAFSTVREGHHRTSNDITYAVKCVNRKKLSEEDEAALLDEVGILKNMKHPHIIRLYDFFVTPSTYYLVMERMSGGELFDRIVAKAYYNEKEARDVCKILIQAIGYCHLNRVAHRDLKPENLLLLAEDDDSAVKIADFGFAKIVKEPNSLKTQCGTPGYVAPEILDGIPYDQKCDMWSCGVILYILLGGYPPFIENNQRELFRKIRKGDYEFHPEYWQNVSKEAKELISALLTVDVDKRLTAEQALDNRWIRGDDKALEKKDLGPNLAELKKFNAKRKFKAAVYGVMASNKLQSLGKDFQKNLS